MQISAGWTTFQSHRPRFRSQVPNSFTIDPVKTAMLEPRWMNLTQLLGIPDRVSKPFFQSLVTHYSESSRVYHTLDHVIACLDTLDRYRSDAKNPKPEDDPLLELAIWCHDLIDERGNPQAVPQSAQMAVNLLKQSTLPMYTTAPKTDLLEKAILATHYASPPPPPLALNAQLMVDMDLSILGQSPAVYNTYTQAIRQEYQQYNDTDYAKGRAQVMSAFLKRPALYNTPWAKQQFETQARANIQAELKQLTDSP